MAYQVVMPILDHQSSFDTIEYPWFVPSEGSDVDEQPRFGVDPSRINHIELVCLCRFHV